MSEIFGAPGAPSNGIDWESLNDSLLLFTVHAVESGIATAFGEKEAVRADVAVLDGASTGEVHTDALVFPKLLIGQLRGAVGGKVLARLGQGTAKPGQKPPWVLAEATDADKAVATAYLNGAKKPPF